MRSSTILLFTSITLGLLAGCARENQPDRDFHTSGSRDADQRADQRIAQVQQIRGEGSDSAGAPKVKPSLYDRVGGEKGVAVIVDDFVTRVMADPRVNFTRKGIKKGGVLGVGRDSAEWKPTPEQVDQFKKHLNQFLSLAMAGPAKYDGQDMQQAHKGLKITNAEFDATIGDMKASLDALRVATEEQKELLSILESTRPQVVEER